MRMNSIRRCRVIVPIFLGVASVALPVAGQLSTSGSVQATERTIVSEAVPGEPVPVSRLPAIVEPVQSVAMSVPADGLLMRIEVAEGDRVARDQILAQLDNRVALASVKLAEQTTRRAASIQGAESTLDSARRRLERLKRLGQAVSDDELDQAQTAVSQAETNLELAREQYRESLAQLELERARLDSLNIRAPFDGVVIQIDAQPGQTMTRSDSLLTLANLSQLKADLHLPVEWFGKVHLGDRCKLKASAPVDAILDATIVSMEPRIDAATRTFRCQVEIDNADQRYPAGFSVQMILENEK